MALSQPLAGYHYVGLRATDNFCPVFLHLVFSGPLLWQPLSFYLHLLQYGWPMMTSLLLVDLSPSVKGSGLRSPLQLPNHTLPAFMHTFRSTSACTSKCWSCSSAQHTFLSRKSIFGGTSWSKAGAAQWLQQRGCLLFQISQRLEKKWLGAGIKNLWKSRRDCFTAICPINTKCYLCTNESTVENWNWTPPLRFLIILMFYCFKSLIVLLPVITCPEPACRIWWAKSQTNKQINKISNSCCHYSIIIVIIGYHTLAASSEHKTH